MFLRIFYKAKGAFSSEFDPIARETCSTDVVCWVCPQEYCEYLNDCVNIWMDKKCSISPVESRNHCAALQIVTLIFIIAISRCDILLVIYTHCFWRILDTYLNFLDRLSDFLDRDQKLGRLTRILSALS